MKFNPVTIEEHNEIVELFHSDFGMQAIMQKYKRDYSTIKKIWLTNFSEAALKSRVSRLCRLHKTGDKNPMSGRVKELHPRWVDKEHTSGGYIAVGAPDWYTGRKDGNKVYEHIIVYCEYNGLTSIPKGMVVHHLDCNKQNNSPDNLILLSIPDHRRIHAWFNKVQRLSSNGVGDSVPEVPDFLVQEVGYERAKQLVEEGDIV